MPAWTINSHSVWLPNESLAGVSLWSDTNRPASSVGSYRVRVGIGRGSKTDWIGEYDGSVNALSARSSISLTGTTSVDRLLAEGDALIVEVTRTGTPGQTATGLAVEWQLNLVGGDSRRPGALFSPGGAIADVRTRAAVDGVVAQLNKSGVQSWTVPVYLTDPIERPTVDVQEDYDASTQTVSSTSFVAGNAAVTFTKPQGASVGRVMLWGGSDAVGNGGTGIGHVAIGDGTTDANEKAVTTTTTTGVEVSTAHVATITATTTFTLRLKRTTANVDFSRQVLAGTCTWSVA